MFAAESVARRCRGVTAAVFLVAAAGATPALGQPTLDVPYVPTAPKVVETMLDMANVGPQDYIIDLGSGDGRIVIAAAKRHGARGFGVDLDEFQVARARGAAERAGVSEKVRFFAGDLFLTDISQATVLTMYLFPSVNVKLRPRLFADLRPGTRVVSHDFDMEQWEPDAQLTVAVPDKPYGAPESQVYLWVIPANAAGTWHGTIGTDEEPMEFRVELAQTFQMVSGTGRTGAAAGQVWGGRLRGKMLRFTLTAEIDGRSARHEFEGLVNGDAVAGRVKLAGGVEREWRAHRVRRGAINITPPPPD